MVKYILTVSGNDNHIHIVTRSTSIDITLVDRNNDDELASTSLSKWELENFIEVLNEVCKELK